MNMGTALFLFLIFAKSQAIQFSNFTLTKVYPKDSDESRFLKENVAVNKMICASQCSDEVECQKLLFCASDNSCRMYKDGTNCILPKSSLSNCDCIKKEIRCNGNGNCTCPWGQYGLNCEEYIKDCKDGIDRGFTSSATMLVAIKPSLTLKPFDTVCVLNNMGWITILDRLSSSQRIDFNRILAEYEEGFGDNQVMQWLGFKRIHELLAVTANSFRLMISIVSSNGSVCYSYYNNFGIGPAPNYTLAGTYLNGYSKCGDSLLGLIGKPFSTKDSDVTGNGCSNLLGGGWWYNGANGCSDTKGVLTAMPEPFWKNDLNTDIPKRISMKILRL